MGLKETWQKWWQGESKLKQVAAELEEHQQYLDELKVRIAAEDEEWRKRMSQMSTRPMSSNQARAALGLPPPDEGPQERFDPEDVNWKELMTLYQDDPLLMAIFTGMQEYISGEDHPKYSFLRSQPIYSPGSSPVAPSFSRSYSSSTNPVKISDSFTLSYDTGGNYTITTDNKTLPVTLTWSDAEE